MNIQTYAVTHIESSTTENFIAPSLRSAAMRSSKTGRVRVSSLVSPVTLTATVDRDDMGVVLLDVEEKYSEAFLALTIERSSDGGKNILLLGIPATDTAFINEDGDYETVVVATAADFSYTIKNNSPKDVTFTYRHWVHGAGDSKFVHAINVQAGESSDVRIEGPVQVNLVVGAMFSGEVT